MSFRGAARCLALLGLGAAPLLAQAPFLEPVAQVRLGVQGDGQGGRSGDLAFDVQPNPSFSLGGQAVYSRLETPGLGDSDTVTASLEGAWHTGRGQWGLALERTRVEGEFTADRISLRPARQWTHLRLGLEVSRRFIRFDTFGFENVPLQVGTDRYRVSGSATASLEATGMGLSFEAAHGRWRLYGSGRYQAYGDPAFQTSVEVIRLNGVRVGAAGFQLLAASLTKRMERLAGSQVSRQQGLLEYDGSLGVSREFGRGRAGIEYYACQDHFSGSHSQSLTLIANWARSRRLEFEFRVGGSHSDQLGSTGFLGLGLVFRKFRKPSSEMLELLDWPI